jgi:hypothetical protein
MIMQLSSWLSAVGCQPKISAKSFKRTEGNQDDHAICDFSAHPITGSPDDWMNG